MNLNIMKTLSPTFCSLHTAAKLQSRTENSLQSAAHAAISYRVCRESTPTALKGKGVEYVIKDGSF
jgi:hypothetical protein